MKSFDADWHSITISKSLNEMREAISWCGNNVGVMGIEWDAHWRTTSRWRTRTTSQHEGFLSTYDFRFRDSDTAMRFALRYV